MKKNKFEPFLDTRGSLLPIEFNALPFEPKRIFLVSNVPTGTIRGEHAHYETEQFLLCVDGSIEVILHDGEKEYNFILKKNEGLLVPKLVWDAQKFLENESKLLVFCSTNYNEQDYIFDFDIYSNVKKQFTN